MPLPPWLTLKLGGIILGGLAVLSFVLLAFHWKHQAAERKEQIALERAAHAQTVANYRAAAEQARKNDAANKARVEAEQAKINQESNDAYEKRLADARAVADRLRREAQAYSGSSRGPSVPSLSAPASGAAQAASKDGFSLDDRLTATEQAIQLDELIKWVKAQHQVDVNGETP